MRTSAQLKHFVIPKDNKYKFLLPLTNIHQTNILITIHYHIVAWHSCIFMRFFFEYGMKFLLPRSEIEIVKSDDFIWDDLKVIVIRPPQHSLFLWSVHSSHVQETTWTWNLRLLHISPARLWRIRERHEPFWRCRFERSWRSSEVRVDG